MCIPIDLFTFQTAAAILGAVEAAAGDPGKKMMTLMPIISGIVAPRLADYGFPNVMMGVMQLKMVQDADVQAGCDILQKGAMGNPPSDEEVTAILAKLEA